MEPTEHAFDPRRYEKIDTLNQDSWYLHDLPRAFDVIQSVHSIGTSRDRLKDGEGTRYELAGNMSTKRDSDGTVPYGPKNMTDEERYHDAVENMRKHLSSVGIDMARLKLLNPERDYSTPLTVVDADADSSEYDGISPVRLEKSGDFVYTRNPDTVLGVRPADCPIAIIASETTSGPIGIMVHFAWRGPASGQFDDMEKELARLGVQPETMKVYITPGGHAETYQFNNYRVSDSNPKPEPGNLFTNVKVNTVKGKDPTYSFGVDTPNAVYQEFIEFGLDAAQVFLDTSNTTAPDSGYASHSRAVRSKEDNARDLFTVQFHNL